MGRPLCVMIGLGGPTFITDWAKAVATFGTVVGLTPTQTLPPGQRLSGRMVQSELDGLPAFFVKRMRLRPTRWFWRLNARLEATALYGAVRKIEGSYGCVDILHSHFYAGAAALPGLARRLNVPFVHTEHSSRFATNEASRQVSKAGVATMKRVSGAATSVLLVSQDQREVIAGMEIHGNFKVIPNPVDAALFTRSVGHRRRGQKMVTVGHLIPRKRHSLILKAFAIVVPKHPNLQLDIVGGGPERDTLQRLARDLGLDRKVRFLGHLPRRDVAEVLLDGDLYVHTSERESFGVAIVEALMAGLPVITTRCGGVTDELRHDAAEIVDGDDPLVLARAIESFFADPRAPDRGPIATWATEQYGIDAVGARVETVYRQAIARKSHESS